jgi:hypothetical protein
MIKFNLLLKRMWMALAILFCSVVSANAAEITYSLTTHVDGRTITGVANVAEGASLEDNMPQDLWRGYTTYKYYSDQALTQEITTAPAENATVYVDYVFDPPFLMSNDNDEVWNYLRNYNGGGSSQRYVYYENNRIYSRGHTSNAHMKADYTAHWAFYGDGYSFHAKNRSVETNPWLIWGGSSNRLQLGEKQPVGWQLYANAATNSHRPGGTVSFGIPETTSLAYLEDLGIALTTRNITSDHKFDDHNQLVAAHTGTGSQATQEKNALWWYAFFASPISSYSTTTDIWHVTYKIQKEDGTWYDDIVVQKSSSNLTPSWPVEGFTEADGCEYDYFYTDATFTEKFEGAMPNDRNSILYIKETKKEVPIEYVSEPWKTLVIPFGIENLASFFGEDFEGVPAVDVLELQGIEEGVVTPAGDQEFYRCKLIFNPVDFILPYKPYLIRLNRAYKSARDEMYAAEKGERDCEVTIVNDPANAGISVYMEGTLEDNGYSMDASDGLHFYFGYDDRANAYNFYRVSAQIPRNRCWFEVVDQRPAGAKLNVTFDMDAITGIGQVVSAKAADGRIYNMSGQQVQNTLQKGIYIVNGKKVIVK